MIPLSATTPQPDESLAAEPAPFRWRRRAAGGLTWTVREDWVDRLCESNAGLPLAEWERAGRLETVKSQPLRTVYRLRTEAGEFFIKRFRTVGWQSVARNLLRGSQAGWEAGRTRLLMERHVPTARLVAWGEASSLAFARDSVLVTESLTGTRLLTEVLASSRAWPRDRRVGLIDALARVVARLHHVGLLHGDLHTSNILVRQEADETWRAWLLDLTKVRVIRRDASLHQCRSDFVLLHHTARIFFATEWERQRFFLRYWRARQVLAGEAASSRLGDRSRLWHELVDRCEQFSRRLLDGLDRRWADGNHHQVVADRDAMRCRGVAWLGRETLECWRDRFDQLLTIPWPDHPRERFDGPVRLVRVATPRGEIDVVVISASTAARHGWHIGHALGRRGIPCAQPLMFVEGNVRSSHTSALVMQRPGDHLPLRTVLTRRSMPSVSGGISLREIGLRVATLLRKLHDDGFADARSSIDGFGVALGAIPVAWEHLSQSNPLLGASVWRPDALDRHDRISREVIRSNLASLVASVLTLCRPSRADWLRWLKAVLRPAERGHWKEWWRELESSLPSAHSWRRCA